MKTVGLPDFQTFVSRGPAIARAGATAMAAIRETSPETQAVIAKLGEQAESGRLLAKAIAKSARQAQDEARAAVKNRSRAHVERLKEEYKLIAKMWAHNPAEMARQLGRIAKELKRAVADYASAAKANGERVAALGPEPAPPARARGEEAGATAEADAAADASANPETQEQPQQRDGTPSAESAPTRKSELADAIAAYTRLAPADPAALTIDERREIIDSAEAEARGDLDFARDVKGFIKKLREELTAAKIRAGASKDDATREAFEATEKTLKEIEEDIGDMEADIDEAFPDLDISASPAIAR